MKYSTLFILNLLLFIYSGNYNNITSEVIKMDDTENNKTVFGASLTPAKITEIIVSKNKESETVKAIESADKYFQKKNEKIDKKTRDFYDKDGKSHSNPSASNVKLKSNFLRKLVTQKKDYGFSKSFIFRLSNEVEKEIDLDSDNYGKEWKTFLNDILYQKAKAIAGEAINHGIAWCYLWIDKDGKLQIKNISAKYIYPEWKDLEHTDLDKLVYNYVVNEYNDVTPTQKEYAEYWSSTERILFDVTDSYKEVATITDSEGNPIYSHMTKEGFEGIEGVAWDKIPFVCLKGTDDEMTLLSFIKDYIDAYDELDSKSVDGLNDDLDPLLVFKGITPDIQGLIEARELAKMTRTISLDSDGDAGYIQAQTAIDAHLKKLQDLKQKIIEFGYGVDYEDARFNGNPNQLVIKSLFQNMDTYVDGLERHFQNFINDLKYFFDKWYEFTGKGSFEECQKYNILIELDRNMMINKSALIDDSVKLAGTGISQRTQFEFNPAVQDVDMEFERIEEEQKEAMKMAEMFDFPSEETIPNKKSKENKKPLEEKK